MTVTYRSFAHSGYSSSFGSTVALPTGTVEGDLLILHVATMNTATVVTPGNGFEEIPEAAQTDSTPCVRMYSKLAGASEPAEYDIATSVAPGTHAATLVAVYSDIAASLVYDGVSVRYNASGNTVFDEITTTIANILQMCFAALDSNVASAQITDFTERLDVAGGSARGSLNTRTFVGPGATGDATATHTTTTSTAIMLGVAEQSPALDTPTALTATAASASQIDLAWEDTNDDEDGFAIERSADGLTGWVEIDTTAADELTYSDTGLGAGETWYYRVRAFRN